MFTCVTVFRFDNIMCMFWLQGEQQRQTQERPNKKKYANGALWASAYARFSLTNHEKSTNKRNSVQNVHSLLLLLLIHCSNKQTLIAVTGIQTHTHTQTYALENEMVIEWRKLFRRNKINKLDDVKREKCEWTNEKRRVRN